MLPRFDSALSTFNEQARAEIHGHFLDTSIEPSRKWWISEASALGIDVYFASTMCRETYIDACETAGTNYKSAEQSAKSGRMRLDPNRFSVTLKSSFFFIRAFQDSAYRIALTANKQEAGPGSSMAKIIGPNGEFVTHTPLGKHLAETVPTYPHWFLKFRELRNNIKAGSNFAIESGFNYISNIGAVSVRFQKRNAVAPSTCSLDDVSEALEFSAALCLSTYEFGRKRGTLHRFGNHLR